MDVTEQSGSGRAAETQPARPVDPATDRRAPLSQHAPSLATLRAVAVAVVATIAGSIPILAAVNAVPWRVPILLTDQMFSGFVRCTLRDGALNPIVMHCPEAGVPAGMYATDAGLSYPLGGLIVRAGATPLLGWRLSVTLLVLAGTGAMFWLLRRLSGSAGFATAVIVIYGFTGTFSSRGWNWYWRSLGTTLLSFVMVGIFLVFAAAEDRSVRRLALPLLALTGALLAVSLEWAYAGLFAAAAVACVAVVVVTQRGWSLPQRGALLAGFGGCVGVVAAVLQLRLRIAGIDDQMNNALGLASRWGMDVAAFVTPHSRNSLLGEALDRVGGDRLLATSLTDGYLDVAPYVGVFVVALLAAQWLRHRFRVPHDERRPAGLLAALLLIVGMCVLFALGPQITIARTALPGADVPSPLVAWLYGWSPLQWIRFPRTWTHLLKPASVVLFTCLATAFLRRDADRWSPLVVALVAVLALESMSPLTHRLLTTPGMHDPSSFTYARVDRDDAAAKRFATQDRPVLTATLRQLPEPVLFLPWDNLWTAPSLGPDEGIRLRNAGIDRNFSQAQALSPFTKGELNQRSPDTVRKVLDSNWARTVVMVDWYPHTKAIRRYADDNPNPYDLKLRRRRREIGRQLESEGYCVHAHGWFTAISTCPAGTSAAADT